MTTTPTTTQAEEMDGRQTHRRERRGPHASPQTSRQTDKQEKSEPDKTNGEGTEKARQIIWHAQACMQVVGSRTDKKTNRRIDRTNTQTDTDRKTERQRDRTSKNTQAEQYRTDLRRDCIHIAGQPQSAQVESTEKKVWENQRTVEPGAHAWMIRTQ